MKRARAEPEVVTPTADDDADLSVPFGEVDERLRQALEGQGVAIVTGVVGAEELAEMERLFASDLSDLVDAEKVHTCADPRVAAALERFERDGPRHFPYRTVNCRDGLAPESTGFLLKRSASHGKFAWRVRAHPNVHRTFAAALADEPAADVAPLVSSLDATFFTPVGASDSEVDAPNRNPSSAHVDQNGHDERPACVGQCTTYQGVLYVWPSDDTSTTTVVWPGSHLSVWPRLMQQPVYREQGAHGVHYSPLACLDGTALGAELADGWQLHGRRLRVPAGAVLRWNSHSPQPSTLTLHPHPSPSLALALALTLTLHPHSSPSLALTTHPRPHPHPHPHPHPGALLLWNSRVVHCGWQGRGPRLAQAVCRAHDDDDTSLLTLTPYLSPLPSPSPITLTLTAHCSPSPSPLTLTSHPQPSSITLHPHPHPHR